MNADEIVKALNELGDALDKQPTDWPTGGNTCYNAADLIEWLKQQLAESQRQLRAAVGDLRKNRARKCDCCVYAGRSERWPCVDCQSPISNYGDGWKWRGPQEAER